MTNDHQYYTEMVNITEEFLGPAAERFVNRQIDFHLNKQPKEINRQDVLKLKESLGKALGLLTNNQQIVDQAKHKFDVILNG